MLHRICSGKNGKPLLNSLPQVICWTDLENLAFPVVAKLQPQPVCSVVTSGWEFLWIFLTIIFPSFLANTTSLQNGKDDCSNCLMDRWPWLSFRQEGHCHLTDSDPKFDIPQGDPRMGTSGFHLGPWCPTAHVQRYDSDDAQSLICPLITWSCSLKTLMQLWEGSLAVYLYPLLFWHKPSCSTLRSGNFALAISFLNHAVQWKGREKVLNETKCPCGAAILALFR